MKRYAIFSLAILLIFSQSCKIDNKDLIIPVTGTMGEIIIVAEEAIWGSSVGDSLKAKLAKSIEALPQPEPMFDLINIPSQAFTKIIQTHRNIIITKVSGEIKKPTLTLQRDVWAAPQVVFKLNAPDKETLKQLFVENHEQIINVINNAEIDRLKSLNLVAEDNVINKMLKDKHKINLLVPKGYVVARNEKDFVWLSYEPKNVDMGIVIYYYNYTDTSTFTDKYLISKRDSFMAKYVEGETPGTFMTTEKKLPIFSKEISYKGAYAYEMRGLWYLENDFMGGPFISLTTVDEVNNRIVTVEGFIYSPKYEKRFYLRKAESVIYSLSFDKPKNVEEKK